MATVEQTLEKLSKSKFRSSFHLTAGDKEYVRSRGLEIIEGHARDFISKRLSPEFIPNDGAQTPTKGHPVFKAQHACACCCRGCLNKWYKVPKNVALSRVQEEKIVNLLMAWIRKEMDETNK